MFTFVKFALTIHSIQKSRIENMDEYFTIQNNMKCCKLCGNHSQFALGKPKLWMDHLTDTHKIENLEEFKLPTTSVVKPLSISEAT